MNRTNLVLLAILAAVVAIWASQRDWGDGKQTGPAPRMFPDLNKEAADRIEMSGGWLADKVVIERVGSDWQLASAGGYPLRKEKADEFIDAVANLRRENLVGSSAGLREETETDAKSGRLVRVFKGDTPMAAFRVGKSPKSEVQFVFIRPEDEDRVYRTRTILSKDADQEAVATPGGGPRGFDWHNNVLKVAQNWTEGKLWELGDLETQELWLTRPELDVKLVKKGQDVWEVHSGDEVHPGDVDAINSLTSQLKWLYHAGIAGRYDDVAQDLGLDTPAITLVMTFRRKIEKEATEGEGEEKEEGDEEKEGTEGEGEEKKEAEPEYEIVKRTLEVGTKITRPRDRNDETGEVETEEVYPIRIGGEFDDPKQAELADFVFFVSDYRIGPLRKKFDELIQKKDEEEPGDDDGAAEDGDGSKDDSGDATDEGEKKDDAPKDDAAEPKKDDEAPAEPKKDDGTPAEPKKEDDTPPAEPKKDDG
jgi:hypothetical protein